MSREIGWASRTGGTSRRSAGCGRAGTRSSRRRRWRATCFWAGDTFAPKLLIKHKGVDQLVQQFLQNAYLDMSAELAKAVGDLPAVLGFEMMNEPHRGYIDLKSLHECDYNTDLHLSYILLPARRRAPHRRVPLDALLPHADAQDVRRRAQHRRADGPTRGECVWAAHGVWGWDKGKDSAVVLQDNYFVRHPRTGDKFCPASWTPAHRVPDMVRLGTLRLHNVQGLSRGMFPLKVFYWGQKGARDNFALQLRNVVEAGYKVLGETPVLVGECGVPMDMKKGIDRVSVGTSRQTAQRLSANYLVYSICYKNHSRIIATASTQLFRTKVKDFRVNGKQTRRPVKTEFVMQAAWREI
ncbi:hypothetical protein B0H17DRAFT_1128863 [Mycena rosella]|uniref:Uncharacterized protein n=1 Tax=Mycena rosella TaxID=1033263 RepID=A0AAD7DXV3_MYCRO|nr:hypothetical protein B0H17DRAFT_1128863 [Mycena rosella]